MWFAPAPAPTSSPQQTTAQSPINSDNKSEALSQEAIMSDDEEQATSLSPSHSIEFDVENVPTKLESRVSTDYSSEELARPTQPALMPGFLANLRTNPATKNPKATLQVSSEWWWIKMTKGSRVPYNTGSHILSPLCRTGCIWCWRIQSRAFFGHFDCAVVHGKLLSLDRRRGHA